MKRLLYLCFALLMSGVFLQSCDNEESYSDQKDKERKAINNFISRDVTIRDTVYRDSTHYDEYVVRHVGKINVISEEQFYAQDSTTDVAKNEYVLFNSTGVYMQIMRKGAGEKMANGDKKTLYCRFLEYNILQDVVTARNDTISWAGNATWENRPEVLYVQDTYGTFASMSTSSALSFIYQQIWGYADKVTVPSGWLIPLTYINIGRQTSANEEIAKVRLILPHTQGHTYSTSAVVPYFYEITYQEAR